MMIDLQPYISTIVQALLGLLVAALLGWVAVVRGKFDAWLNTRTTVQQREMLHTMAGEATALIEATYKDAGGPAKLSAAYDYVSKRLRDVGINMSGQEIQAALEKSVQEFNLRVKGAAIDAGKEFEQH